MNTTSRSTLASNPRLKVGAAVLAGAQMVDTTLVKTRIAAVSEALTAYAEAERKVDEVAGRFDTEKLTLAQLGAEHDEAVEKLACCLAADGAPRLNPFAAYDAEGPAAIKSLPPERAARAIRALLAALERAAGHSDATRAAATRVEELTHQVDAALLPLQAIQDELRAARRMSDVAERRYDTALSALRRAARAAADDGAPGLYAALFPIQRTAKKAKPAPTEPQPPASPAA